jgi:hypothetical protein
VDVARASDQIDALIDKRAAGREEATAAEMAWKASVRKHNTKLRRQHRAEWYCYFAALADSLRRSADHYERRALELLEDENTNGRRNA